MPEIAETLQFLLKSDHCVSFDEDDNQDESFINLEDRQARYCQDLINLLKDVDTEKKSIREIFSCKISALTPILCDLLSHRVEREALLPATQDAEANEEALSGTTNAMTLTFPTMIAAQLYASLLSTPGALGSGLVEIEAITALTAVLRRWSLECCGREELIQNLNHRSQRHGHSPTKSPPKKRSRSKAPVSIAFAGEELQAELGPQAILEAGLQVATALCRIPIEREFTNWSSEAREALLEALLSVFASAAAMKNIHASSPRIVKEASIALQESIKHSNTTELHETTVVLLRGLLRILQFKEILPNGERGKVDAHTAAGNALEALIQKVSKTTPTTTSSEDISGEQTPSKNRRRLGVTNTPGNTVGKTPKSQRRRVSLDGVTPMLSPALKKSLQSTGTLAPSKNAFKPSPILSVFLGMLQKLTTSQGFERAIVRTPTVVAIQKCVASLPLIERAHFLRYLLKLCQSKVSIHRLVACEIIGNILTQDWLQTHDEDSVDTESSTTPTSHQNQGFQNLPVALWKALQGRLVDRIAAVRARAATSLEAAVDKNSLWMEESLLSTLRKRALTDETATVRKASMSTITKILLVKKEWLSEWHLSAVCELCQDNSLLTRKAAAECLTKLLEFYDGHPLGSSLEEAWSNWVLPMVLDQEAGSKATALMDRVIVSPILEQDDATCDNGMTAWRILANVGNLTGQQGASKGAIQALQAALKHLKREDDKRINQKLLYKALYFARQAIEKEASESLLVGAWCLLENLLFLLDDVENTMKKLSGTTDKNLSFCVSAWQIILQRQSNNSTPWLRGTLRSSLLVASRLASALDFEVVESCLQALQRELQLFSFSPGIIGAAISALGAMICPQEEKGSKNGRQGFVARIRVVYDCCEQELTNFVQLSSADEGVFSVNVEREQKLVRALFTVGELSMVGFCPDDDDHEVNQNDKTESDSLRGLHEAPSKGLQQLVQTLLSYHLPGKKNKTNPALLRAHAFTVLGKLCLRDERLTKSSLNLLARELHPSVTNPDPTVQSNALLVLGDLSVRYTNMTDRYLPVLASCLQAGSEDPEELSIMNSSNKESAIVRKHAVLLLSSLLLQDYVKWRGLLFHRFLVACSDEDEGVSHLAENVLSGPLWIRTPKLFYNHFVESLFVLNKYTAHPVYIAAASQGDGGAGIEVGFEGIHLGGAVGEARRRRMYDFLLSKLSDEEKIGVTARLAREVLGGAVSNSGDLGRVCSTASQAMHPRLQSAWNVMNDTFYVLTHKAIRVGKVMDEEEIEDPNVPSASRQVTVAKSRLLSRISRKHLVEIVLPILCNLKTILQANCSPLLKHLMRYLLEIFQTYKAEVKEFLANDPTLLHEIEYDARHYG
jgi:condensin-2 complex subunit D3